MNGSNNIKNVDHKGVSKIYKIFEEIYLKAPTFLKDLSNNSVGIDNTESIREQIDFKKIDTKFKNGEYCLITDAIKDIRTVFLNCYSFYGARSNHTKQSLELEKLLEEKISYLEKNYKLLADVNLTLNLLNIEGKPSSKLRYPKDVYDSVLLRSVAHCPPGRLKKYHKTLSNTLTTDKDDAHIFEKILSWENEVNFNDVFHQHISSMWELPEIGNFLAILFKKLDHDIINQGEIERMFIMPKESTTMSKVMTTLLMPVKKNKSNHLMPYKVWSEKLSKNVSDWCKVYHTKNQNKVIAMDLLGIHPDFWTVVNEKNPLIEKEYSELSYFIKVWLVKGLCDYVTIKFKTINDIVTNCNARQCTIWKNDLETEEYFFFDSMPDLRIYYYSIPYDEPCLEFLESVKTDNEVVQFEDKLTMNDFSEGFHMIQKGKHFKLIADSVESLRAFVYELDMEEKSVPESLISSLENFIVNIEPEEYNYIALNNDSKIQLFKDWESYSDRIQKDKDNISVWEKKDSKSIAKTKNEELIITEKRQRKLIVLQNFDINESDEYVSENDKSLSDFTDSEDEWGAMNQPKFKVKQPQRTPSKNFLELEKRVTKAEKMLKYDTNQSDVKQLRYQDNISKRSTHKMCKNNNKDKSIKSVKLLKTQNKGKICSNNTNTLPLVNGNNKIKEPLQTPPKRIKLEEQLREENTILKHSSIKEFDKKDKNIKSVKLLKTQNEGKICSNNTNTLPLVNGNNKIKQPLQTFPKRIKLEEQLREENTILKHSSIKEFDKKDKNIKSVKLLKIQNEGKICSNNTNTLPLVNDNNKIKQPLQTPPKSIKLEKQLREENTILKHSSIKGFDMKDNNIKSVELLKTQNEGKICSNNTNTLPLVNDNNKIKQPLQTPPTSIKLEKQLREETTILKHSSIKGFDKKDKNIKSVKILKTQNEGKICSNNTNTLPLVNGNNKIKQPLQTHPKRIKLEKQLREENTILKHRSIKGFDKKDKNIKSVKLLKTQNEIKCSNNTNTFVNGHNQRLVDTKNIDIVCSYEEVVIHSDTEESQKPCDGLRQVEIINLDEDMQNDCEVFNDNFESSTFTENKNRKSNEQKNYKQTESSVISIEDDDPTIIIDGKDDVQFISMTKKPKCSPFKNNKPCSLKSHLNKSYNSASANRRITPTNYINHKAKSSIIQKLSQNITIMPANVNIPKGIEVTMVKTPQTRLDYIFNSVKRKANGHPPDNPSTINVKCELISKPDLNGEVKFFVRLPNGNEHPGPNELINQYLKQHNNQLPDYWLVPLPVEVAKQYGFN
ncbi:MATH and LRR domain-containing protein PFE0570w-like [Metopolophium dirhodum]|uniref:MATH and LRR domain-containing protein PFE0570w-like n=1 Tax=Metopolophium dirhodum TaxID=44670 RepID=UPI00298F4E46|nr:MATH and LRR domain-containing protein PFE0570w-like [Metopolophium dirhodum]